MGNPRGLSLAIMEKNTPRRSPSRRGARAGAFSYRPALHSTPRMLTGQRLTLVRPLITFAEIENYSLETGDSAYYRAEGQQESFEF